MAIPLRCAIRAIHKTTLYGSIGASAMLGTIALVQAQDSQQESIEEIIVEGIRGSLQQSLNTKRFADAIVDAISAEDIGKFPDKNIGESLSRVPGVTISRDFGEGQGVTIRGLAPGLNITLLNGQAVGTAQWFVLSEAERNFNFEMLSSEMIAGVEVHKSAQADIDEGGLGGTVILRTRKPLELEANTIQGSIEGQYGDLGEDWDPSASGLYSWKNAAETMGVLLALSRQERTVRREATETFGFFGPADTRLGNAFNPPTGATEPGILPWGVGSALFQQDRERDGVDFNVQWRPNEKLNTNFHYFFSEMEADNQNQNFIAIPFRGLFAADVPATGTVENGIVTSLAVDGGDLAGFANHMAFDSIFRDGSSMETEVIDLEATYQSGDWSLHGQLGTTTGEGVNRDEFYEFFASSQDPRASFDFTNAGGNNPAIDYSRSPWVLNPGDEMLLTNVFDQTNKAEDTEDYVQLDLALDVDFGAVNELKFGVKIREREFTQDRFVDRLSNAVVGDPIHALGTAGDFSAGTYTVDHDETSLGKITTFDVNRGAMRDAFVSTATCGSPGLAADDLCVERGVFDSDASFSIEEDITALYAMASFAGDSVRGNVGLRYVETDTTSKAFDLAAPVLTPVSRSGDYNEFLPSANLVWDMTGEVQMRFAAGRAIARPAPFQLTSAVNLTPETSSGDSGNPDLEPLTANQYEISLEWYPGDASLLSGTLFKKDIEDFIFTSVAAATIDGQFIARLRRPENGPSATLEGVELIAQHAFDNGFGFSANYTYTDIGDAKVQSASLVDGEATLVEREIAFPLASKDTVNLTGFYETESYSARLNYSYRSEFFKSVDESGETFGDEQEQWDAQFSYTVNDNVTVRLEALNLTGETIEDFYRAANGQELTATQLYNGRRFFIGASFKY